MEKIRKGNDISILWEIMRGTEEVPYDLTGKDLTLYIKSMYKTEKVTDFTTDGNVLKWTFLGKNQSNTGVYSLTLVENEGKEDMHTVDECHAFELVNCSSKVGGDAESHVQIKIVSLKSAILLSAILPDKELDTNSTNVVENGAIAREFEATNKRIDELKIKHEVEIDSALSTESENPVMNKVITDALNDKQDSITDLGTIRSNANKGATAVQPNDLSRVATSGSYTDLSDTPDIPSEITESTVSGWGFTKNVGTYVKPNGGIPKEDLSNTVQESLGKADTALQTHQDISHLATKDELEDKQESLVSGVNIKTINGESVLGGGNIEIKGGGESYDDTELRDMIANKVDKIEGKGLSTEDYTTEEKEKLASLKNYDDTAIKADIESLKTSKVNKSDVATVNGQSLLNGGNITISGGGSSYDDTELRNLIANKADKSGEYLDMSVGLAEDLGNRPFYDEAEFSFRSSAGEASVKDGLATIVKLKGNSVVWNQLTRLENFVATDADVTNDGQKLTVVPTGVAPGIIDQVTRPIPIVGHKYILLCEKSGGARAIYINWGGHNGSLPTSIFSATDSSKRVLSIFSYNETETFTLTIPKLIDLTKMFQAGNEPTTIEEFYARKPIVEDEYAYNEGEVIHMTAEGIKSVGDNAWDEEWENGRFSNMGIEESYSGKIRSKNYIPVLANVDYCYTSPISLNFSLYDKEYRCVGSWQGIKGQDWDIEHPIGEEQITFVAGTIRKFPRNVSFIKFSTWGNNITTYNSDIMLTLVHSGWKQDTDAGYQPYWEDRLMFDQRIKDEFPNGMKKWDMVYNKDGKGSIVKGTRVVKMKDLNWMYYTESGLGNTMVRATLEGIKIPTTSAERVQGVIVLRYYPTQDNPNVSRLQNKCWLHMNGEIFLKDDSFADAESFVASLTDNDVIIYELAEPTIIEYDEPFNLDYKVADFGTEQAIAEQPSAPISAKIEYGFGANDTIRTNKLAISALKKELRDSYATTQSVREAIEEAITTTLNTKV